LSNKLVAVYGTLKKNLHNYNVYLAGYEPVFTGFVDMKYQLFSNGRYPMAVNSNEKHSIYIEIYNVEISKFEQLVALEEPFGYHYESIRVTEIDEDVEIFVYTTGIPPDEFSLVESGNWEPTIEW
jgi:gamma-glutamylcyclotransferase (GGCT)/AIG2-like uncharacterized protein YtfP